MDYASCIWVHRLLNPFVHEMRIIEGVVTVVVLFVLLDQIHIRLWKMNTLKHKSIHCLTFTAAAETQMFLDA